MIPSTRAPKALLPSLLGVVLLLLPVAQASAGVGGRDGPGPWVGPGGTVRSDRHLLLQTEPGVELLEGETARGWSSSGVDAIDAIGRGAGIVAIHRVHGDPDRGRRNPALFRALGLDRIYYVEFASAQANLARLVAELQALDSIRLAWIEGEARSCRTPNDPQWSQQWNLAPDEVNCELAWDDQTTASTLVAVLDSGIERSHPDIDASLWKNSGEVAGNGQDDDGNGYVDDVHGWDFWNGDDDPADDFGHGTHVAGILGAEGDNGRDIAGVCWKATIQQIKVLSQSGAGAWTTIAQGIVYAADNGAKVANYSLGGATGDPGVDAAVQYAAGLDVVQAAAAGNNAKSTEFFPAAYEPVIAVMATDIAENRAGWSNYGDWCDVCAPGDGITSLWLKGATTTLSGTSQASPHVAAIAAMVRTANPDFDRIDTELVILHSARDIGTAGRDSTFQWGLADLHEALRKARSLRLSSATVAPRGSVDLDIDRPDAPGEVYLLLPSISGRTPGYDLADSFAGETRTLPLNPDYLTTAIFSFPDIGIFIDFVGVLDPAGRATATLNVPGGRLFVGIDVDFSGLLFSPTDLTIPTHVLNSTVLHVR